MNSRFRLNTSSVLFFVQSLCALLLVATGRASASGTGIKDTNYPIPAGAYFVSPNGLDTNSGNNPASPWSVTKALNSAPSGATIVFRDGTYRNIKANINKKLTLQSYPHEKAWIKGSIEVEGWVADGARWRKDGWSYSFPPNMGSGFIDPKYPLAGYRDMVYIDGVSLKQVASIAEVVTGTFYVNSTNKQLYIGNNPVGKKVEATALTYALAMWQSGSSQPANTIIRGLGFAHYADRGIDVGAPRVTLEDNTFVWNGQQGVKFYGQNGTQLGISSDAVVRGNTFSRNGRNGLWGQRAHRMLVENNYIGYNNVERFSQTWDAAGIKALNTDGLIWRNNIVEYNVAIGMWVDESSTNAKMVRNTVRHNNKYGIFFEVSHKAIIAANVIYKNITTGIHMSNSSGARVYNNTLAHNGYNLLIDDTTRNNTNADEIAAGITWISRDHVVMNNIFSNTLGQESLFHALTCGSTGTNENAALMIGYANYNAYYRTSSSSPSKVVRWSLGGGSCLGYTSIAAFNSATSYEANALAIDNVATNPFFVDEANGDYRLKTGSPAIGYGEPLPPDIASAIGLPSGVKVDLGALQATVY